MNESPAAPPDPAPAAAPVPLAERLTRAVCVVGLVQAAGVLVSQFVAPALRVWPRGFSVRWGEPTTWLFLVYGLVELGAVGLLVGGAAGELLRRPWARRLLVLYVVAWAVGWAIGVAVQYVVLRQAVSRLPSHGGGILDGAMVLGAVGQLLSEAAYALLLTACLRWPETRRTTAAGRGFAPVLLPGPAAEAAPTETVAEGQS